MGGSAAAAPCKTQPRPMALAHLDAQPPVQGQQARRRLPGDGRSAVQHAVADGGQGGRGHEVQSSACGLAHRRCRSRAHAVVGVQQAAAGRLQGGSTGPLARRPRQQAGGQGHDMRTHRRLRERKGGRGGKGLVLVRDVAATPNPRPTHPPTNPSLPRRYVQAALQQAVHQARVLSVQPAAGRGQQGGRQVGRARAACAVFGFQLGVDVRQDGQQDLGGDGVHLVQDTGWWAGRRAMGWGR